MKPRPETSHEVHELIRKRWSPRAFSARPLDAESILTLFEAARWAASCANEQPWRFIYTTPDQPERYGKLFSCLTESNQSWVKTAPLLALTLVKTQFEKSGKPNRWAFHDLGLAIGNLTTQATTMGIYVHNMAGFSVEKARELFDLAADLEPVTMIAIGYLGDPEQLVEKDRVRELVPQQRKPLDELMLKV
ncbi:MAG: nitroreductase family protein [bacterium]|nr:nitroreductase family protein [bacterium]